MKKAEQQKPLTKLLKIALLPLMLLLLLIFCIGCKVNTPTPTLSPSLKPSTKISPSPQFTPALTPKVSPMPTPADFPATKELPQIKKFILEAFKAADLSNEPTKSIGKYDPDSGTQPAVVTSYASYAAYEKKLSKYFSQDAINDMVNVQDAFSKDGKLCIMEMSQSNLRDRIDAGGTFKIVGQDETDIVVSVPFVVYPPVDPKQSVRPGIIVLEGKKGKYRIDTIIKSLFDFYLEESFDQN